MRLFRMYLKGECMCEMTLHNAKITLADCLGSVGAEKALQKLSEGDTIALHGNWIMQEKF